MKISFLERWFGKPTKPDFSGIIYVDSLADIPKQTSRTVYVVSNGGRHKWVVFQCPNNCGKRIEVNLMQSRYPFWHLKIKKGKVSLSPSIVVESCGAHFFLIKNKIVEAKFSWET